LKKQLEAIAGAIRPLLESSDPWQRIEAARTMLALHGILVPESSVRITDPKAVAASRHLREVVVGRLWRNNEIRRRINRRAYLKRQIAQLNELGGNPELLEKYNTELAELLRIRKRVPRSEMPAGGSESTQDAPVTPVAPVDPVRMAELREWAERKLKEMNHSE